MEEKKLCRKCKERPVANGIIPYCHFCWNHLDSAIPEERNALVYYGNKMYYAQHPEAEKRDKEKRKNWNKAYIAKNREKWNAYQREYHRRKKAELAAKLARLAELEAQQTAVNS